MEYRDYRELLKYQGLDGVVIATPLHLHEEHTIAALEAGLRGQDYPGLLREGFHASIGALLGEQAILSDKPIEWPEKYKMPKRGHVEDTILETAPIDYPK